MSYAIGHVRKVEGILKAGLEVAFKQDGYSEDDLETKEWYEWFATKCTT
jgi:hypothetical protein